MDFTRLCCFLFGFISLHSIIFVFINLVIGFTPTNHLDAKEVQIKLTRGSTRK